MIYVTSHGIQRFLLAGEDQLYMYLQTKSHGFVEIGSSACVSVLFEQGMTRLVIFGY